MKKLDKYKNPPTLIVFSDDEIKINRKIIKKLGPITSLILECLFKLYLMNEESPVKCSLSTERKYGGWFLVPYQWIAACLGQITSSETYRQNMHLEKLEELGFLKVDYENPSKRHGVRWIKLSQYFKKFIEKNKPNFSQSVLDFLHKDQ